MNVVTHILIGVTGLFLVSVCAFPADKQVEALPFLRVLVPFLVGYALGRAAEGVTL